MARRGKARRRRDRGEGPGRLAKDAIDQAFEAPLSVGLAYERRNFALARASEDAGKGLRAFVEKRAPDFRGR